jgi:hypothetical protein
MDAKGKLYILEEKRVSKWDASGQYECAFGSFGQGPGEFMSLEGLFIHEDGRVFLNDQGRALVVFMEDGSFLQRISLSQHLASDFFVDGQDNIFGLLIQFSPEAMHGQLAKLDPKGNLISIFSGESPPDLLGKSGVMGGLIHSFSPMPYICRVLDGICFGYNMEYSLRIFDSDGKLMRHFYKQEKTQSPDKDIAAAEVAWGKDYVRKNVVFPKHRPFFQGLISDEHGRIFVLRTRPFVTKDKRQDVDIYDKCGNFLYQITLPYRPSIIRNGAMYVIDKDAEGWSLVRRIEIKNINQLHVSAPGCR